MDTENEKVGCHGLGRGRNGQLLFNEYGLFWEGDKVLEMNGREDYTTR